MADILFAIPKGFNIRTTTGVLFSGEKIPAPLPENILIDIQEKPYRWDVAYVKEEKKKLEKSEPVVTVKKQKEGKKPTLMKNKK